ncbi:MAG: hypothetical protein ACERLG_07345 [Sedimentibacter sp.]
MIKRNLIPIFILLLICCFIIKPAIVSEGASNGLKIWVNNIVPFLFPMSILSNILLHYNFLYNLFGLMSSISSKVFKNKYAMIPFFISFISGYPSGAMAINIMANNKRITQKEANYLIVFANDCSFQFIAGVVAFSMLGNFQLYKYIAIPHFLGAIILSLLLFKNHPNLHTNFPTKQKSVSFNQAFSSSIYKSVIGILSVGGVIVIFSVFSNFFENSLSSLANFWSLNAGINKIFYSLLIGSLEVTNGCSIISSSPIIPIEIKLTLINFLISFSGMSVIFQTMAVINDFEFDIKNYIFFKFIHGIISALLCIGMLVLI